MLKHWLVRNGNKVTDPVVYVMTDDQSSEKQVEQVISGILKLGWKLKNVFIIESANNHEYKSLKQFLAGKI